MKQDSDIFFEGGPYNGNSFRVPDHQDEYLITSSTMTYSTVHEYKRENGRFVYVGMVHQGPSRLATDNA